MLCKNGVAVVTMLFCVMQTLHAAGHPGEQGTLQVSVRNVFAGQPLVLNKGIYHTMSGDNFSISNYKYYISNIHLLTAEGKEMAESDSYHLVNEAKSGSKKFDIEIPDGTYSSIRFMIGVDSLHNVTGAQTGALDPINAMFWDWHTGYINAKLEGRFNNAEQSEFSFHVGGFAGKNNTLRWVTLEFAKPILIAPGKPAAIVLISDAAEWLKGPYTIDLVKMPAVATEGADATGIADNYANMFSLSHVE